MVWITGQELPSSWRYYDTADVFNGSMRIKTSGIADTIMKIHKCYNNIPNVIEQSIKDCKGRVHTIVSRNIREVYNINRSDLVGLNKGYSSIGNLYMSGFSIEKDISSVYLKYSGRALTPLHFGMKPEKLPNKKGYKIKAKIKKGKFKTFKQRRGYYKPFLFENPLKRESYLPADTDVSLFQKIKRYVRKKRERGGGWYGPYKSHVYRVRRTVSLPQMIEDKEVSQNIKNDIAEMMGTVFEKRLKYHFTKSLR